jgi:hypothetical protein
MLRRSKTPRERRREPSTRDSLLVLHPRGGRPLFQGLRRHRRR